MLCIYIYIYTSPQTPTFAHELCPGTSQEDSKSPSTQAAAVATVVGLKFGV